jgi:hypothetical protein
MFDATESGISLDEAADLMRDGQQNMGDGVAFLHSYAAMYRKTFAGQQWQLHRAAEPLWAPFRWWIQRRLRKLDSRMAKLRDDTLRRFGLIP